MIIWKYKFYVLSFTDYASGIRLPDYSKLAVNWKKAMTSKSSDMTPFFLTLFCFSYPDPSFMSISSLILESWQFPFMKDWPEIRKLEILLSEFCPISGDWDKLGIPNLVQTSLIKCCWFLQNARVTAFTVSELLRENQQWGRR